MLNKFLALVLLMLAGSTLNAGVKVLAFAGSTREESINKKLIVLAANCAREARAEVTLIDLKNYPLPFYDADIESNHGMPSNAKELRKLMIQSDVIMIASPEYNGSVAAVLKNMIDWTSRSEEKGPSRMAFKGKKFILMSASPGAGGGAQGLEHLRTILTNVGGIVIDEQISLANAYSAFDEQGKLKDPKTKGAISLLIKTAISADY